MEETHDLNKSVYKMMIGFMACQPLLGYLMSKSVYHIIIIIIIILCRKHRYLWPSLATSPYHSSLLAGLQDYIPYPHRAAVCMFELVILLLLGHMQGSIGAGHPAFAWPYAGVHRSTSLMSLSLLLQQCPAYLVCLAWIVFMIGGRWPCS